MDTETRQQGFSIIQVLVALGVSSILLFLIASLFSQQSREMNRVSAKGNLVDIESSLRNALRSVNNCVFNLGGSAHTFNSTGIPSSGPPMASPLITTNQIYDGDTTTSPLIIVKGSPIPSINRVTVTDIQLTNWHKINSDEFRADLGVPVESTLGPLAPIKVLRLKIQTEPTSPVSAKEIIACSSDLLAAASPGYNYDALKGATISCNAGVANPNGCDGGVMVQASARVDSSGQIWISTPYSGGWVPQESVSNIEIACWDRSKVVSATVSPYGLSVTGKHEKAGPELHCFKKW